jgi:uncharacterized coiled-coil DUF342 family protein
MSIFGKVLAILNVLAAFGLAYAALLDWTQRQSWAYHVYRMDFPAKGLPVDQDEIDSDGHRRIDNISDATIQEVLKPVGGLEGAATVLPEDKTQLREVKRVHDKLKNEIDRQPNEAAKREKLKSVLLPLADTLSERQKLDNKKLDELMGDFEKAFAAVTGKAGQGREPEDTRRLIAHLLFCTTQADSQPERARERVAVVVGLKAFTHEVNLRAHALQQMGHQLQAEMVADRSQFDREQRRILGELELLARDLDERKEELDRRQTLVNRHTALVKAREADIVELKKQIDAAGEATKTALTELAKEQGRLFGVQSQVGEDLEKNSRLEQQMRTIENAR